MNLYEHLTNGALIAAARELADRPRACRTDEEADDLLLEMSRRLSALTAEKQAAVNEILNKMEHELRAWARK